MDPTTPAPPSEAPRRKIPVRRKVGDTTLTAMQLPSGTPIELPTGVVVNAQIDDWVITRGNTVVEVCRPKSFSQAYEVVESVALRLSGRACAQLDGFLGPGSTDDEDALVKAAYRLALAKVGEVAVTFTTGQWEALQHRAEKMGLTVQTLMERITSRVVDDIFTGRAA